MTAAAHLFKTDRYAEQFFSAYDRTLSLWKVPHESVRVETGFGSTHVIVCGPEDGTPLVLLHGFGFGASMWYANIESLAREHRVFAIDVIGEFNKSVISRHFRKKSDYADWLSEVMDRLGLEQADWMGHSNGGWHCLNFAIHAPHRVKRLVLLAPAASFTSFSLQFPVRLLAANLLKTRRVIVDFCGKWFIAKGNEVSENLFDQFYYGLKGFKWKYKILVPSVFSEEELARIQAPCLLLVGDQEVIYRPGKALRQARKRIPHIRSALIANAGHGLMIEQAETVNRHIAEFLEEGAGKR